MKLLLPALFCLGAAVFSGAAPSCAAAAAPPPRIGVALPSFTESRWNNDLQSLQVEAEKLQADILVRFAGNDQSQQNIQIKELVALGADVLILVAVNSESAAEAVEFSRKSSVPVVAYDRPVPNGHADAYVTFDSRQAGELMARELVKAAPSGDYVIIEGPSEDNNSATIIEGAMRVLQPLIDKGDIRIVESEEALHWSAEAARRIVRLALDRHSKVAAVFASNDDTAGGAADALAERGLAGKVPVCGQDAEASALGRIQTGTQTVTIFKDTDKLAEQAMQVALALHAEMKAGKKTTDGGSTREILLPVTSVTKEELPWLLRFLEHRRSLRQ